MEKLSFIHVHANFTESVMTMKLIPFALALAIMIGPGGCSRTVYVQHPSVDMSAPAPEAAPTPVPVSPETIPAPAPTPAPPPVMVAPAPIAPPLPAPAPTPELTPAPKVEATPAPAPIVEATPTPKPDREAGLNKPYPRVRIKIQDEAPKSPDFAAYRDQLNQAVAQKNLDALLKLVDSDKIVSEPGGKPGVTAFLEHWKLTYNARQSPLWDKLAETLRMGAGSSEPGVFHAPSIGFTTEAAAGVLDRHIDPADRGIITATQVNARSEPSTSGQVVDQLSSEIVKLVGPADAGKSQAVGNESLPWYEVVLPDGKHAFVYGKYIRPWNDYRATFVKSGDQWKMTELK